MNVIVARELTARHSESYQQAQMVVVMGIKQWVCVYGEGAERLKKDETEMNLCQVVILFCSCAVWRHLGVRDGHTKLYRQIFPHPSATHISIWLLKMTHPCQVFDWVRIFWQLTMFPVVWKTKSTTETFMSKKKKNS